MMDVTAERPHTESEIGSDSAEEEAEVRGEAVAFAKQLRGRAKTQGKFRIWPLTLV